MKINIHSCSKMLPPIKRTYQSSDKKPIIRPYNVNLSTTKGADEPNPENCEVTEFESSEGWAKWENSVLAQNIEELVVTIPAPLQFEADNDK